MLSPRASRAILHSRHPADCILSILVRKLAVGVFPATASDSGTGGSASGITHIRDTGNSGYSGGVSGASVVPAAAVDHFNPGTDLAPVITVVKASTDMSSVAFAASAGENDNGSGWGDVEKPLDMLLEEELEMWKEKNNDSMDEGAQEDEQVEIEIDNRKTVGSEVFPRKMADVLKMFATNPIR